MKTKLGKLLSSILPNDKDVQDFDAIRKKIKTNAKCGADIMLYKKLIAKLEVKLSGVRSDCTSELKEIEKKKFKSSNFTATSLKFIENDSDMVRLYNKIKVIDAIKKNLNI